MFSIFGVGSDLPVKTWLEMSYQGKAVGEFTAEDIGMWVLDGLQQVVEKWDLCDHRWLSVGFLAVCWQCVEPFSGGVCPFAHKLL